MILNGTGTLTLPRPDEMPRFDFRHNCGRLLFRGFLPVGTRIEIRCPRCNGMMVYNVQAASLDGNGDGKKEINA